MISEGITIIPFQVRRDNDRGREGDKSQSDHSEKHSTCYAQFPLASRRNVGRSSWVMDADGQFKSDPVLHQADAELRPLLDPVHAQIDWLKCEPPGNVDRPGYDSDESKRIKEEDGQILVLLLHHQNHEDVAQCKHDKEAVSRND